jgi:4-hydroxybenzoate polyprenyltransferase
MKEAQSSAPLPGADGEERCTHGAREGIRAPVLCVDLDGSLIKGDLLFEGVMTLLKRNPLMVFSLLWWLIRGKVYVKTQVAARTMLDPTRWAFNQRVLSLIEDYSRSGARVMLTTSAHRRVAQVVADHIGKFDIVLATGHGINLGGKRKLRAILDAVGERPFAYVGNAREDFVIWTQSAAAYVVDPAPFVLSRLRRMGKVPVELIRTKPPFLHSIVKALRLHQWLKNVLVFVPVIAAHKIDQWAPLSGALCMFLAFGLTASSIYLVNDLMDLDADRRHPRKRNRPFAAGDLSIALGLALAPLLLVSGLAVALWTNQIAAELLLGYAAVSLSYTFLLKRYVVLDVITLASLYTLRIVAGAAASVIVPSFWLLAFSMFLFLSLATVKRVAELHVLTAAGTNAAVDRDYAVSDAGTIRALGISAGYLSVFVFALYMNAPEVQAQYKTPQALWAICVILLYWLGRLWVKTDRGEMHDDPLIFTALDWNSRIVALFCVVIIFVATVQWV